MRVLLVTSRYPFPSWRGNQVRTVQWLNALAGNDLRVVCPRPSSRGLPRTPVESWFYRSGGWQAGSGLARALLRGRPLQEGVYDNRGAHSTVAQAVSNWRPDVVVVQMVRCAWAAESVLSICPQTPIVFDAIDSMALHFERAAAFASPIFRLALQAESKRCRRLERWISVASRITCAVARRDLEVLEAPFGRVVPVAAPPGPDHRVGCDRPTILLSGNLGYRPTVKGCLWFADHVWRPLKRLVPTARWVLAGARPRRSVRNLAHRADVEVHADPDHLGPFRSAATVSIAPMATGSGVPMKVLEAMAAGLPVVADPWAAEGLEEPEAVAIARGPESWVSTLHRVLTDQAVARELGRRGHDCWARRYHPDRVRNDILDAVDDSVAPRP